MEQRIKNNGGFGLLEFLIVVALMLILAGISIPQFLKYREAAKTETTIQEEVIKENDSVKKGEIQKL